MTSHFSLYGPPVTSPPSYDVTSLLPDLSASDVVSRDPTGLAVQGDHVATNVRSYRVHNVDVERGLLPALAYHRLHLRLEGAVQVSASGRMG